MRARVGKGDGGTRRKKFRNSSETHAIPLRSVYEFAISINVVRVLEARTVIIARLQNGTFIIQKFRNNNSYLCRPLLSREIGYRTFGTYPGVVIKKKIIVNNNKTHFYSQTIDTISCERIRSPREIFPGSLGIHRWVRNHCHPRIVRIVVLVLESHFDCTVKNLNFPQQTLRGGTSCWCRRKTRR